MFGIMTFEMPRKEEVNTVSINMMELGFDMLYEPRSKETVYESCAVCGENLFIKVVAQERNLVDNSNTGDSIVHNTI